MFADLTDAYTKNKEAHRVYNACMHLNKEL